MPGLSDFLDRFRSQGNQTQTHTAIGGPGASGGAFTVPSTSYDEFLDAYSTALSARRLNLTERPASVFPAIADIDLQYDDPSESLARRHGNTFVVQVAAAYANAVSSMRESDDRRTIRVIVLQRESPYVKSPSVVRDGLHIFIPSCRLPRAGQSILRKRALPALRAAIASLPGQSLSAEDAVDACYADNGANWQLYGSAKPGREAYLVSHEVFVSPCSPRSPETLRALIRVPPRRAQDWGYWCRRLSVRSNAPHHVMNMNEETRNQVDEIETQQANREFEVVRARMADAIPQCEEAPGSGSSSSFAEESAATVERARRSARLLGEWRADSYHTWRDVGFALRNTSSTLVDAWHQFSARSEKYDRHVCQLFWDKLNDRSNGGRARTIGSLVFWAKQDSPSAFQEMQQDDLDELLLEAVRMCNHTDWGAYYLKKNENKLRATPDGQAHSIYVFDDKKHRWVLDEDGSSIKRSLKSDIVSDVQRIADKHSDDADFLKLCTRAKNNLKTRGFRDNVLVDIKESVSDANFRENLDANPNLIGWENGVFDLEAQVFRDGEPDDFITMSCHHVYKPPDHPDYAGFAEEFEGFMAKLHTNAVLRKYCLDVLASSLSGKTIFEIMHTWTGSGSNGKTRMLNLMDMALGDYYHTAPPSLLTGHRPDSGRATPELCAAMGARLLVMSEVDGKATINVAVMKELSGGEKIATRELYKKSTVMVPQFTMLLTCNDLSKVDSNDDGTWRRLKVLPFRSKFVLSNPGPDEFLADTSIESRMQHWAPYVLSMLQQRYPGAVRDMATDPPEIKQEVMNYRAASDLDQDFLAKNMVRMLDGDDDDEADAWALLNTYRREGRDSNITLSKLQDKLARFGVPSAREADAGRKVFPGWKLVSHGRN